MASRLAVRLRTHFVHTLHNHKSSTILTTFKSPWLISHFLPHPAAATAADHFFSSPTTLLFLSIVARRSPAQPKKSRHRSPSSPAPNTPSLDLRVNLQLRCWFCSLVLNNFREQLVFYVTPTDALEKYKNNPSKTKFRLGGLVLEGNVNQPASSKEMEFVITDLITDILVRYEGSLPDLFREGYSVVVEGFVKPFTEEIRREVSSKGVIAKARSGECYFSATEVLAKHDEKYMPQEVAAAIDKNKKKLEEGQEGGNESAA